MRFLILFVLVNLTLQAQSKLYPNINPITKLEQTLEDNTLKLSDPEKIITKVVLYNKKTLENTLFENSSRRMEISLNELPSGSYTVMTYLGGDIIVFRVDVDTQSIDVPEVIDEVLKITEKPIKYYRIIETVNYGHTGSRSRFNVFTEERKNKLIQKNKYDLTTKTGKGNTLEVYVVYQDKSEELIYKTE